MSQLKSVVLVCKFNGIIQEVLNDDFGFEEIENKLATSIIDKDFHSAALDMLVDVKKNNIALNYNLTIHLNKTKIPVGFTAIKNKKNIILIGVKNDENQDQFSDNLLEITNDQTNQIRTLLKERLTKKSEESETELLFNELSSLNNELINLQRSVSKKNSELKRLNEIKNNFIGMAAHDLRNPLTNISSMADFLDKRRDDLDKTEKKFLNYIKSQSTFLLKMVTELLDVSAIESGSVKLDLNETDVISLINQNIAINKGLAEKKEINIHSESNEESVIVALDAHKIDQVITNFLTNAIKYSEPGTEIVIAVIKKSKKILVEVKDQGKGIPEDELEMLFKPFQKTSTETTAGEKSTGLGLYIVKRIIEAHKGQVGARSKLKNGSVFFFSLPLKS